MWLIVFLTGLLIRLIAIRHMGIFDLSISRPESIKVDGIYRLVRHPSYIGSILMFIGLSILSVQVALVYFVIVFYISRAIQEESILRESEDYRTYVSKTGMFFPKLFQGVK